MWDVQADIEAGELQTVLDDFVFGFQNSDTETTGLQVVYPNRRYLPVKVSAFIDFFKDKLLKRNK